MTLPEKNIPFGFCHCGCNAKTAIAPKTNRKAGQLKGAPLRFLPGHQNRRLDPQYIIEDRGYKTPCWIWQWYVDPNGYGHLKVSSGKTRCAHVVYWEEVNGPKPEGMDLDHLCHNPEWCKDGKTCIHRRCVNPDHLEPATRSQNILRGLVPITNSKKKTHCIWGHAYDEANSYRHANGQRSCLACRRIRGKIRYVE